MLCTPHYIKLFAKFQRFERILDPYLFRKAEELPVSAFVADRQYHEIPADENFDSIESGWKWGGEGAYCWIKAEYTVPESLDGKDIFVMPRMGGYEAMLWVDGVPFGTFNTKIVYTGHGNHYCGLIRKNAKANEIIKIAIEYYAGHSYHGCNPFSTDAPANNFDFSFWGLDICVKNELICDFYFDLKTVTQLASELPEDSFMRANALNALTMAHKVIYYSPEDVSEEEFFDGIRAAHPYLKAVLSLKNSPSAPVAGLVGHSHIDTAWLWHIDETVKKCARTFSNQLSLMEQYPEHRFIQSSSCHSNMIRKHYPELFSRIKDKVSEDRYEPNGAVWVECDCNITSGESLIRQFLWGQRFTKKHFNYLSDCFWLPDTFGYSAALPQIMKGCRVNYFLTTKLSWNDTNTFPYNTFRWEGIDGSQVFAHFNVTHAWPDPKELRSCIGKDNHSYGQPTVTQRRLMAYGFGDGGGGPQFEMLEMARRCSDLYEIPKTYHTSVSDFMKELEKSAINPCTYRGELYLELHRGTLTNQHEIKYNNRKAELALRDLELLTVSESVKHGLPCNTDSTNLLYETLLINQFHDILPGTCIGRVHKECKEQMKALLSNAKSMTEGLITGEGDCISVTNTLSHNRRDVIFANDSGRSVHGVHQQTYTDISGISKRLLGGITVPAFSSVNFEYGEAKKKSSSPFTYKDNVLTTPFAKVTFNRDGFISSFIDTTGERELVEGLPLNTLLMAEDVPMNWDNWDIDADVEMKFKPCAELLEREIVSAGDVAFIIRQKYKISNKSNLSQDVIFFADSPEVRFDTVMDWQDDHRFLKVAFDTNVREDFARHEIQFGYCKRPTTRNNSLEQAKFEVANHKYTDLSETGYGVALLNDCKYGISVKGSEMRLSLHKGGTHPDINGDHGLHRAVYSFLPHSSSFGAESVILPSYELNVPHVISDGVYNISAPLLVDKPNIIVETVKPCEDGDRAYIVRLYEAEGTRTNCEIKLCGTVYKYAFTNMLEEAIGEEINNNVVKKQFRPFEIVTVKAFY